MFGLPSDPLVEPVPLPSLNVPPSSSTVTVHLIDTGTYRTSKASDLFTPHIPGFDHVLLPSWSFLISHAPLGKHILFDLGIRKNWKTGFPPVFTPEVLDGFNISADIDVRDILNGDHGLGIRIEDIDAVIWSHHHFDHRGDITLFPARTELVVGPGLKEAYTTYAQDADGEIWEAEFQGRKVRELKEDDFGLEIGGFPAYDLFGDGSLYVLSTPGHTVGHLSALARVAVDPDMFVLMAGDVAHHPGVLRPSPYLPLPKQIEVEGRVYDGREVLEKHPRKNARTSFLDVDEEPMCHSHGDAKKSVEILQMFDADERVLVCIAHESGLGDALPIYPEALNSWLVGSSTNAAARNGVRWKFLEDFDLTHCDRSEASYR